MHTYHTATDRRVYNGAPCSDMQREHDSLASLVAEAAKRGARATYFPMEEVWSVWVNNREVGKLHATKGDALVAFLDSSDEKKCAAVNSS